MIFKNFIPGKYFRNNLLAAFAVFLLNSSLKAQVENVIVETYYISDEQDASDTTGGGIESGSKTYRVFVDLAPGVKLKKIYGDQFHPLIFNSTTNFFNNKADGQTIGKEFTKSRLQENTVALDTWITLGQTTRVSAKTNFGVLKANDDDNSFIGGVNNDGGSNIVTSGLLIHADSLAGIPLTIADGMDTLAIAPGDWADYGFTDLITGNDSSIFGSVISGNNFESRNAGLLNSGTSGVDPLLNHVLVAQLTTTGEISFELNIEVEVESATGNQTIKYVARDSALSANESLSPFLKYPQMCGCQDPNFLEFSEEYACSNSDSCRTQIVFGCTDPLACNYDPGANFNLQEMCCYVGYCADLDISLVCPALSTNDIEKPEDTGLFYPNPASESINFKTITKDPVTINILDQTGRIVLSKRINASAGSNNLEISSLNPGAYIVEILSESLVRSTILIKN